MRYTYACFKGYIGFYNGLGLDKVEINFNLCKSRIIAISGINGSGKSTLLNALNIFPDPSSSFVPNMDGEKILTLVDKGDTYNIRISSPSDLKGGRKQTKAFISKNGLELNTNGNISSYKEIIFSEFELDSNFISLSKLSGDDRGLGDKTPAERKKFASSIIDNLETYNTIYKTLNKKSLIFKATLNNLHTKIQNIGMKDKLELTLKSLREQEQSISQRIMGLNNEIVSIEAKTSIDPEEAEHIQKMQTEFESINDQIQRIQSQINLLIHKTRIKESEIEERFQSDNTLLNSYNSKIDETRAIWKDKSQRIVQVAETISTMQAEVESQSLNLNTELETQYNKSNNHIGAIHSMLKGLKLKPNIEDIAPLSSLLLYYERFTRQINLFFDGLDQRQLDYIVNHYDPNKISQLQLKLIDTINLFDNSKVAISSFRDKLSKIEILSERPKKCNINDCPFIAEALEIKASFSKELDLEAELSKLLDDQLSLSERVTEINAEIEYYQLCVSKRTEYDAIINGILEMKVFLEKFGDTLLSNLNSFNKALSNMNSFNDQKDPKRLRDGLNLLKELDTELKLNQSLEIELKAYKEKVQLIDSTKSMISKMTEEKDLLTAEVAQLKSDMDKYTSLLESLRSNLELESQYISLYHEITNLKQKKDLIQSELRKIEEKSSKALESVSKIQGLRSSIDQLMREAEPITSDIQRLTGQLTLLDSYYEEYNLYKSKYDMIEVLKKYSSPTNGGIQTIFMQLYMNDTLKLSNQVLGMIFGGQYQLLDFIINENEFRIPFIGSGLPVDDISSGSTSQICIMGMVINLVLLYQASTKFNIARLDEIDGGLDHRNRSEFVNVLYNAMPILGIEQLFIISHSIEADTSAIDVIKLKSYPDFEDSIQNGNIIYDYSKIIQENIQLNE